MLEAHRDQLDYVSDILLRRETIEREEFVQLLDGTTEEDVFGRDAPVPPPTTPPAAPEEPERKPERAPKPLPRPGLAAEMRGLESPEKPS